MKIRHYPQINPTHKLAISITNDGRTPSKGSLVVVVLVEGVVVFVLDFVSLVLPGARGKTKKNKSYKKYYICILDAL